MFHLDLYQPIALVASWVFQVRATISEKLETPLDPLERRSGIFAAKGSPCGARQALNPQQ
jgi:hypothetical protein